MTDQPCRVHGVNMDCAKFSCTEDARLTDPYRSHDD